MTRMNRRTLLLAASALGVGGISLSRLAQAQSSADLAAGGAALSPSGDRFGVGRYNTQQVADELRYIEDSIQPGTERSKRILITGSTAGLGQLAAAHLMRRGHRVVAHARNAQRAADIRRDLPGLETVVVGDLRNLDETRAMATQVNALGAFNVIVHNSGEYGLANAEILNANSLSPYLLTCIIDPPSEAMVYLSSDLHRSGNLKLDELRSGGSNINYDDSKLHAAMLAAALARRRADLRVNSVTPGWVPTVMGFHNRPYAPDNLRDGYMTQVWLAEGTDPASRTTGKLLFHRKDFSGIHPAVYDAGEQDALLAALAERTGVSLG